MKGEIDYMESIRWQEQASRDALGWINAKTARERDAYRAGHDRGWRDCIITLKAHGILRGYDRSAKTGEKVYS